jgi:hypothetical protein
MLGRNMKKKVIGMFIFILLIASAIPSVESLKYSTINATVPNTSSASLGKNWTEMQKLLASDGAAGDNFGCYVSISGDAALVGAWLDDDKGDMSGSAYVFTRSGTIWTQQAKLLASDGTSGDLFGWSVSLDNNTALIGAYWDDDNGDKSGSAYVFTRTGTTWAPQAKLLASDGETMDYFGYSVSVSGDTALISAPLDDDNGGASGSAYVFTRTGTTWTQQAKLLAADGAVGDNFGIRVFLAGDTALIGSDGDDGIRGSAYVFTRTGISWSQQAKLIASDGQSEDFFGYFVSLSGDTALIGAPGDNDNGNSSGSAYIFTRIGTIWTEQAKLLASDGYAWDYFGYAVSLYGDTAIVTAPQDDDNGDDSGSAYVFTRTGASWSEQQKLLASDGQAGDTFGWWSVSLNRDFALVSSCRDDDNGDDSGSAYVFTKVSENQPPEIPAAPDGPSFGKKGVEYPFSAVTTDPDGDTISYLFDWGDGENSGWVGPLPSGTTVTATYAWSEVGTYFVKVRAKDENGAETDWSSTHQISITTAPDFTIEQFKGGIGIHAVVKNIGDGTATKITWSIDLHGNMIFFGNQTVGKISSLAPGDTIRIKTGLILGFGRTLIIMKVTCEEGVAFTENRTAMVLLLFIGKVSEPLPANTHSIIVPTAFLNQGLSSRTNGIYS